MGYSLNAQEGEHYTFIGQTNREKDIKFRAKPGYEIVILRHNLQGKAYECIGNCKAKQSVTVGEIDQKRGFTIFYREKQRSLEDIINDR